MNNGPFIPAGTASRDTRAANALCLILCTRLGKEERFPPFTSFWVFLLSVHSELDPAPPSVTPFPPCGMVALLDVSGVSGATAALYSLIQLSLSPSCPCP